MSHPDLATDAFTACGDDGTVPDDPFTSLRYHFGMLLGVDDFETEQGYHRGQMRLHQSWLHGAGVDWGLSVTLDQARNEVRVERGLAQDGAGRPLHLDGPACLDPGAWLDAHDSEVERIDPPRGRRHRLPRTRRGTLGELSDAARTGARRALRQRRSRDRVLACVGNNRAAACPRPRGRPAGPLPGVSDPARPARPRGGRGRCDRGPGPRGRARDRGRGPPAAALAAFRAQANADVLALEPPDSALTAEAPPAPVVLANLRGIALRRNPDDSGWSVVGGAVELLPRRSHIASETAQELAVVALAAGAAPEFAAVTLDGGTRSSNSRSRWTRARSSRPRSRSRCSKRAGGATRRRRRRPGERVGWCSRSPTNRRLRGGSSRAAPARRRC